jgi:hypothetical protein
MSLSRQTILKQHCSGLFSKVGVIEQISGVSAKSIKAFQLGNEKF